MNIFQGQNLDDNNNKKILVQNLDDNIKKKILVNPI